MEPDAMRVMKNLREQFTAARTRKGQKATGKADRAALLLAFSKNLTMPGTGDNTLVRTGCIGEAYPPCILPLAYLEPIMIADLRLETHHRGRVLIVRIIGHAVRFQSVMNCIEDERGDVDRIALYHSDPTVAATTVLPKDAVLAVKEPYYKATAEGGYNVRVDHPSDVLFLRAADQEVPLVFQPKLVDLDKSALAWKGEGNTAVRVNNYSYAVECYTSGVEGLGVHEQEVKRDLYRNRAFAHLMLGQYDAARADAMHSLSGNENEKSVREDTKALYRAARAVYELANYDLANDLLVRLLSLSPKDEDGKREPKRVAERLKEQKVGLYDFEQIVTSDKRLRLDHASFVANTVVKATTSRGNGLFAIRDLKEGDLVLCEKAYVCVFETRRNNQIHLLLNVNTSRGSTGTQAMLLSSLVKKMTDSPSLAPELLKLYDGKYGRIGKEGQVLDGVPILDTFQLQAINEYNTFGFPAGRTSEEFAKSASRNEDHSSGIWVQASYINHFCISNASRSFIGDLMIVRATTDISQGTEITMSYRTVDWNTEERQKLMQQQWGFKCNCVLCLADEKTSATDRKNRASLVKETEAILTSHRLSMYYHANKPTVSAVERLVKNIASTYNDADFKDLPRIAAFDAQIWLCQAYNFHSTQRKVAEMALAALKSLGYSVIVTKNSVRLEQCNAVLCPAAVDAMLYAAHSYLQQGNVVVGKQLEALATGMYKLLVGELKGFEGRYGSS